VRAACLALALALGGTALAANPPAVPSPQRQKELQTERRELQQRIARLRKSIAEAEAAHVEAADALAASETAISEANRRLARLAASRRRIEERISSLQEREREARHAQGRQQNALESTLREDARLASAPAPGAEAEGEAPAEAQGAKAGFLPDAGSLFEGEAAVTRMRERAYLERLAQDEARRVGELRDRRDEIASLQGESQQRRADLVQVQEKEREGRAHLMAQQAARKEALARLAKDIAARRRSVEALERDDARLARLVEEISRLLAEQERRRAAARARPGTAAPKPPAPGLEARTVDPPADSSLGRLRGRLRLPVQGDVATKFGAQRRGDDGQLQAGAPPSRGLFLAAAAGSPVHAIAAGRVVFADWLRGFGNLVIVDHGDAFLSVYANNESLLHALGEEVAADEVIATVGNTGGNARPGLYFELRWQGRAFDPLGWAQPR
jgi:septal ring factor EnvC (AmiA/AmiB activator)